ncbi:Fragile site-associated protein, C-terminal domain-containing protein [Strongyloides ratti]|uniref:Fragile site-associated protein, C-terminal domain-containing protein n=1 Tax=Strongyloides ratti TaxID=34506 RepID=A0A090MWD0_STRRB|nr:Fragile site-associated protein, C-terminal domain-containing protein [Strongyloides ratti]CEF63634.1 Fragile site-associated protein, C-terminal domain-containing protein [Strongyloides ratti]
MDWNDTCATFIWDYKRLVTDLITEWTSENIPDLKKFVPYTWKFNIKFSETYSLKLLLNDKNWIDTSTLGNSQNFIASISGDDLSLKFDMEFIDFSPDTIKMIYNVTALNNISLKLKLPDNGSSYTILQSILQNSNFHINDNRRPFIINDWVEVWQCEKITFCLIYEYHPCEYIYNSDIPFDILSRYKPKRVQHPSYLKPDTLDVSLDISRSNVIICGSLIKAIFDLKNNYFGFYDIASDILGEKNNHTLIPIGRTYENEQVDHYRAIDVKFILRVKNITGHLAVYCCRGEDKKFMETCPMIFTEQAAVELIKTSKECQVQAFVAPACAYFFPNSACSKSKPGCLSLSSGLQFRGQGLFHDLDIPWEIGCVEYGWSMELILGTLYGSLQLTHLFKLKVFIESLLLLFLNKDDELELPHIYDYCQHYQDASNCTLNCEKNIGIKCYSSEQLKFELFRLGIDKIDIKIIENECILNLVTEDVRVGICSSHGKIYSPKLSVEIPYITLNQLIHQPESSHWLETASLNIMKTKFDINLPVSYTSPKFIEQRIEFLKKSDSLTRRLYFLYCEDESCGCSGNAFFFGKNDLIGKSFFDENKNKLAIYSINKNDHEQPYFGQSIHRYNSGILIHCEEDYFTNRESLSDVVSIKRVDSELSFHSTCSVPNQSFISFGQYGQLLDNFIYEYNDIKMPYYFEPGWVEMWNTYHHTTLKKCHTGIKNVTLIKKENKINQKNKINKNNFDKVYNSLYIEGDICKNISFFVCPLAFKGFEIFLNHITEIGTNIHPLIYIQNMYDKCSTSKHEQPLTILSLKSKEQFKKTPGIFINLGLPSIEVKCLSNEVGGLNVSSDNNDINASLLLLKICHTTLNGTTSEACEVLKQERELKLNIFWESMSCRILYLLDEDGRDFVYNKIFPKYTTNWSEISNYSIGSDKCLRVISEIGINNVLFDSKMYSPFSNHKDPYAKRDEISIDIVNIFSTSVFGSPLEMGYSKELSFYDILYPMLNEYIKNGTRFINTLNNSLDSCENWSDLCIIKCFADTLDDDNEKVFIFERGTLKDVMTNSKYLNSCASCCLMLMTLKHFNYASDLYKHNYYNEIKNNDDQFLIKENRKNAIIALLSHWQTIICSHVTLVDNHIAHKFKKISGEEEISELKNLSKNDVKNHDSELSSGHVILDIDTPATSPSKNVSNKNTEFLTGKNVLHSESSYNRMQRESLENNQSIKRPGHSRNGSALNTKEINKGEMDLYHYVKTAANELKHKNKKRLSETISIDSIVNGMELLLDIFFWSVYHQLELEKSVFDGLPNKKVRTNIKINLDEFKIEVAERKARKNKNDEVFSSISTHTILQINNFRSPGNFTINSIRDMQQFKLNKLDFSMEYEAEIESIKLGADIATVGFTNEIIFLILSLMENNDIPGDGRKSIASVMATSNSFDNNWAVSVLDKLNDYQRGLSRKNVKGKRTAIRMDIRGMATLKTVVLESVFNDLLLSIPFHDISLTHIHTRNDLAKAENKEVIRSDAITLRIKKGNLRLTERADASFKKEAKDILTCTLKESTFNFKRSINSIDTYTEKSVIKIKLGDVNGDIPMHAQFVHEMVLKHGPQLNEQFNRLSIHQIKPSSGITFSPIPINTMPDGSNNTAIEESYLGPKNSFGIDDVNKVTIKREKNQQLSKKRAWRFIVDFDVKLSTILLNARLLPSLNTQYKLSRASANGTIGKDINFELKIFEHGMLFEVVNTNINDTNEYSDTFALPLPHIYVNGNQQSSTVNELLSNKTTVTSNLTLKEGNYYDITIEVGKIEHSFSTDLLNQILFAEQSFRSELTHVLKRISKLKMQPSDEVISNPNNTSTQSNPALFNINVKGEGIPWFQLTASTPTSTAIRFTLDNPTLTLTNRYKIALDTSNKMTNPWIGRAKVQVNVKLGQFYKNAMFEEVDSELQELATFMTQISAQNEEITLNSPNNYVFSLNRPILYIKSTAIDKAILLWLNYKNTYDFWRKERDKFYSSTVEEKDEYDILRNDINETQSSDMNLNLSLSIQNGLYICMPLYSTDCNDNLSALLVSLQRSEITVSIKKELACAADFNSFKISFIENFDEHSLSDSWLEKNTGDSNHSNFCYFPHGSYKLFSSASKPKEENERAKWILSIKSHMKGMTIDFSDKIGKFLSLLTQTFSNFGNNDDLDYHPEDNSGYVDEEINADLSDSDEEFYSLGEGEDRTRWLERKMHQKSILVTDLMQCRLDEIKIEHERRKLHKLELAKFKQFRKSVVEKIKRRAGGKKSLTKNSSYTSQKDFRGTIINDKYKQPQTYGNFTNIENENKKDVNYMVEDNEKIDMSIDVQLNIESGQCILRCNPMKLPSSNINQTTNKLPMKPSTKNLNHLVSNTQEDKHSMKLAIPSVGVKVFYTSNDPLTSKPSDIAKIFKDDVKGKKSHKNGCFYLALELAHMPQETIVTPLLADYLEQVIEPLPQHFFESSSTAQHSDVLSDGMPIVAIDTSGLPLDVLFHLNVQSSTIRFEGQQVKNNAADCLLTLPRLTLMVSTRKYNELDRTVAGIHISAMLSNFSLSIYSPHQQSTSHDALSLGLDSLSVCISRTKNPPTPEEPNRIQLVITTTIGLANFNYDLRRLSELLAFPKPWYRKILVKRIFLGEYAVNLNDKQFSSSTINLPTERLPSTKEIKNNDENINKHIDSKVKFVASAVYSLQWKELKVKAQMSNTMGNTEWNALKGTVRGNFDINSDGQRKFNIMFKLDSSMLQANGGAISGNIGINKLLIALKHGKEENKPPKNCLKLQLGFFESQIEWMSRTIFVGRFTEPQIDINDEWKTEYDVYDEETSQSFCFVNIAGAWKDLQMIITKNTIGDFIKITSKLHSFFNEQLSSSRFVWGSEYDLGKLYDDQSNDNISFSDSDNCSSSDDSSEASFAYSTKRYWHKIMDILTLLQLQKPNLLSFPIKSDDGTIIGGTIELDAQKASVACMHGDMNATEWALFHLSEVGAFFKTWTKCCFMDNEGTETGINIEQKLDLKLGNHGIHGMSISECKGLVCRVHQARNFNLDNNSTISFCLKSIIDDSLRNTSLHFPDKMESKYKHKVVEMFILPAFEAVLNTVQKQHSKKSHDTNQVVDCSFICDFHDLVSLLPDPNSQLGFLPKLIQSYKIDDSDQQNGDKNINNPKDTSKENTKDPRIYECHTWHVDPRLQFLNTNRSKWNSPVIDDILKMLKIYDYRKTIPKFLQRGVLDNADVVIAILIKEILYLAKKD